MDKRKVQKLKKFIKELEAIKGRHTELVSVYVPQGYDLMNFFNFCTFLLSICQTKFDIF